MTLPADIARCPGVGFDDPDAPGGIDWREGCDDCQRRTSTPSNPDRVVMMAPPQIIAFWCEHHIPPQERTT